VLLLDNAIVKQINKLAYPAIIFNDLNTFVWGNKIFYSVHKDKFSAKDIELINNIINENIVSSKNKEYSLIHNKKLITYEIIKSQIEIESKKYYLLSFFDISKRKELSVKLHEKQILFETLTENLPDGIIVHNMELIEYTNPTFEKLCGFNDRELKSKSIVDVFTINEKSYILDLFQKLALNEIKKFNIETKILTKKSKEVWVRIKTKTLMHGNNFYFLTIVTDISKEKVENDKLAKLAYFDALTGIYNRRKFDEIFKTETNRVRRYQRTLSALFFDIDHFKRVNDTYGHDIGDEVLIKMSKIIQLNIRDTDYFARWGGEEFILLLPETSIIEANLMAEHIRNTIEKNIFNKVGSLTISIGLSELKESERNTTFIKRLDTALYKAKSDGRNRTIVL
jgi:diguanylate cyclase (GGDEF)-like protein/PAS domain S-box-containing protein